MATFFSRRYMRGKPKRTERLVGVSVLVLLGLIVGVFMLTGGLFANVVNRVPILAKAKNAIGMSERPLFVADPKNAQPAAPPHEMREAMSMLPVLPPPWQRESVQALTVPASTQPMYDAAAGRDGQFWPVFDQFGATWVYRGFYRMGEQRVTVSIADAGNPEAAFGVWKMLEHADSPPLVIGRGGWKTNNAIDFWAGRYFTDVYSEKMDTPTLEFVARAANAIQLAYGGPFWADEVLPKEQRVEKSFRYVRKQPLGLAELSDCWFADYANDLTIGVMRPASAAKILEGLRQHFADAGQHGDSHSGGDDHSGGDGHSGGDDHSKSEKSVQLPEALVAGAVQGTLGTRSLFAFESGPHLFVVTGKDRESIGPMAKTLYDRWSGATASVGVVATAPGAAQPQAGGARFADVDGIDTPVKIERFTDNLYEKIDGREGQYRAYKFAELRFGQYVDVRQKQSYDVYLYDMAEPVNAMGVYSAERSKDATVLDVGRDGYSSGGNVYFWKGRYYVNVLAPTEAGQAAVAVSKQIAVAIAGTIADKAETFWAEELLPQQDRLPHSFKYRATSALGYDFLESVYLADYKTSDKTYTMFISKAPNPQAAHELFLKLAAVVAKYDKVVSRETTAAGEKLLSDSLGVFAATFTQGEYLGGVVECDDQKLAAAQAELLRERVSQNGAASKPAAEGH